MHGYMLMIHATCISFKHKNIKIIEEKLNSDFNNLCDWFLSIHFGEDKTKSILFSPKNLKNKADDIMIKRHNVTLKTILNCGIPRVPSG